MRVLGRNGKCGEDVLVSLQVKVKYDSCAFMAKTKLLLKWHASRIMFWDDTGSSFICTHRFQILCSTHLNAL